MGSSSAHELTLAAASPSTDEASSPTFYQPQPQQHRNFGLHGTVSAATAAAMRQNQHWAQPQQPNSRTMAPTRREDMVSTD